MTDQIKVLIAQKVACLNCTVVMEDDLVLVVGFQLFQKLSGNS